MNLPRIALGHGFVKPIIEKKMTYKQKQGISKAVFPSSEEDSKVHYPINDIDHARNALSRVAAVKKLPSWAKKRNIKSLSALKNKVKNAVYSAYPSIDKK